MTTDKNYLSDEELNALIAETESEGLVQAPKGLHAEVISRIDRNPAPSHKESKTEFYRFTYKVVLSVAAAVLLMAILPRSFDTKQHIPTREEVLNEKAAREEIHIIPQKQQPTKDELLEEQNKEELLEMLEKYITENGGITK
ncbi:hypothetical protein D6855_07360 [Butyrivibrio sp. CB08]|uniref:hypothetical protein n=1 Tax=Butyrivibrio sp. CB08 TaxID=2364879 RepID=UPI000EAA181B|nr:hypothetical protein [Butyrivibrio sp. CB08]RKM60519.1 hypothetical protein D6855_07360 [Butyrivibrio sp. CB08]